MAPINPEVAASSAASLSLGGIIQQPTFTKRRSAALPLLGQLCDVAANQVTMEAARIMAATLRANDIVVLEPSEGPGDLQSVLIEAYCTEDSNVFEVADPEQFQQLSINGEIPAAGLFIKLRTEQFDFGLLGALFREETDLAEDELGFAELIGQLISPLLEVNSLQIEDDVNTYETLNTMVVVADPDASIRFANKAFADVVGGGDLLGKSVGGFVWVPEHDNVDNPFESSGVFSAEPFKDVFLQGELGARIRVHWRVLPMENGDWLLCGMDRSREHELLLNAERVAIGELPNMGDMRERRAHWRRVFPTNQSIAPYDGGGMPSLREFYEVRCRDMSPAGFSFYSKTSPDCERIVALFGTDGSPRIPLVAEIMHITPVKKRSEFEYIVGCKYVRRLKLSS